MSFRKWMLALGAMVLSISVSAQSLRVGYFELAPHAYTDKSGASAGAAVEFFKVVAQKMGIKDVTFQQVPLSRLLVLLEGGEVDAALFIGQNPERAAKFYYPSKPYFMSQPGLAVNTSSSVTQIKSAEDIKPLKIGIVQTTLMSPSMQQTGLNLEPMAGAEADSRNIQKLIAGRLDAVYNADMSVIAYVAKNLGVDKAVRLLPLSDPVVPIFTIFNKAQGAILGARYEQALDAVLKEKGSYAKAFLK